MAHSTKSLCHVRASSTSSLSLGHDVNGGLHTASIRKRSQKMWIKGRHSPVQMHYDPGGSTALQRSHVLHEELHLRRLGVLAAQHYDVHKPVGEGVPERAQGKVTRGPPACINP